MVMQFNLAAYLFGVAVGLSLSFFLLSLPPPLRRPASSSSQTLHRSRMPVPLNDTLRLAVLVEADNKNVLDVLNKTFDSQRTTYFVHEESWPPGKDRKGRNVVQARRDAGSMKYQALHHICSRYLNTTQWCVITDDTVYTRGDVLASVLLPLSHDSAGYASYHSGATRRNNGYCGHGNVEIVSHGLLTTLCGIMTSCEGSTECIEREMRDACSTVPLLQIDGVEINCHKKKFLAHDKPQNTMCTFIHSLSTVEDMALVHRLAGQEVLYQLHKHLNDLQFEIDRIRYLSSPVAAAGARGGVWDMSDLVSRYSLVQQYDAQKLLAGWRRKLDQSVSKVLALLNTTVTAHKVLSVYWRLDPSSGVLYVVNMEVGSTDKGSYMVQAHLQLPVWYDATTIGSHTPVPSPLSIVIVVSDPHYIELSNFLNVIQNIDPQHTMKISLIIVRMGYMILSKVDHLLSSLHLPHVSLHVINDVQWTSRPLAIALALQYIGHNNVVLLGDIQVQLNYSFLQRCASYAVQGSTLYVPHVLVHSTKGGYYYWLESSDIVCVHGMDLHGVTTKDSTEVSVAHVVQDLVERGLDVVRAPDDGLLWIQEGRDCAGALIGEPCEGDSGDSGERYAVVQHSQLLMKKPIR